MAAADQKCRRQILHYQQSGMADSALGNNLRRALAATVRSNNNALRRMLDRYGYPGIREVGSVGVEHLWWLFQHADEEPALQRRALALAREQWVVKNLAAQYYAFLQDRVLVNAGEKQWYGTQLVHNVDSTSFEPRPVLEPEKLNERRALLGLGPIEDYVQAVNRRHGDMLRRKE